MQKINKRLKVKHQNSDKKKTKTTHRNQHHKILTRVTIVAIIEEIAFIVSVFVFLIPFFTVFLSI